MLHDVIVEEAGWTFRAGQRQWTELDLIRAGRLPGAAPSVAVDACGQLSARAEFDRVLCPLVRRQRRVITALELDELPRLATR